MSNNEVIITKWGIINPSKISALVTTNDGALLIIDDKSYPVKSEYSLTEVEPVKSRTERVFNVFRDWFERIVTSFEETLWKKSYDKKCSDYSKLYWEKDALQKKNKELEIEIQERSAVT